MTASTQNPTKFRTELTEYSTAHADKTGPYAEDLDIDALIVGAGFGMKCVNS